MLVFLFFRMTDLISQWFYYSTVVRAYCSGVLFNHALTSYFRPFADPRVLSFMFERKLYSPVSTATASVHPFIHLPLSDYYLLFDYISQRRHIDLFIHYLIQSIAFSFFFNHALVSSTIQHLCNKFLGIISELTAFEGDVRK